MCIIHASSLHQHIVGTQQSTEKLNYLDDVHPETRIIRKTVNCICSLSTHSQSSHMSIVSQSTSMHSHVGDYFPLPTATSSVKTVQGENGQQYETNINVSDFLKEEQRGGDSSYLMDVPSLKNCHPWSLFLLKKVHTVCTKNRQ